jgi:hypothetical protein
MIIQGSQGSYGPSGNFKGSYTGGASAANDSPTRRFKKLHGETKISRDLLGAGDDPMAKNQESSLIDNNPAQLMAMSFKKPSKALSRYPTCDRSLLSYSGRSYLITEALLLGLPPHRYKLYPFRQEILH